MMGLACKPLASWCKLDNTAAAGINAKDSAISTLFQLPTLNTVMVDAGALPVASWNQYARPTGKYATSPGPRLVSMNAACASEGLPLPARPPCKETVTFPLVTASNASALATQTRGRVPPGGNSVRSWDMVSANMNCAWRIWCNVTPPGMPTVCSTDAASTAAGAARVSGGTGQSGSHTDRGSIVTRGDEAGVADTLGPDAPAKAARRFS
mmetsp:Transcript_81761/g.249763  ORF Transcript_81761/g.249763 Transcript_81761/m.249763 type:complete len:210 (-) Transcript_81761:538-1167(-)